MVAFEYDLWGGGEGAGCGGDSCDGDCLACGDTNQGVPLGLHLPKAGEELFVAVDEQKSERKDGLAIFRRADGECVLNNLDRF